MSPGRRARHESAAQRRGRSGDADRARRIGFRLEYLEAVENGSKQTTLRTARLVRNLQAGHALALAFGSRFRPHRIMPATCTAKAIITPRDASMLLNSDSGAIDRISIAAADGISIIMLDQILLDHLCRGEDLAIIRFARHEAP